MEKFNSGRGNCLRYICFKMLSQVPFIMPKKCHIIPKISCEVKKKMKRKMVVLMLTLGLLFCYSNVVSASDDFVFESNGDGTCKITETGTFENVSELLIPSTNYSNEQVTELDDYTLFKCEAESVTISGLNGELHDSVLEYSECKNLVIDSCNLKIGSSFASNLENLETLTITDCELEFDDYAFFKLGDDATVNISNSTLSFGDAAFEYSGIKEITIDSCDINANSSFFGNSEDIVSFTMKDSSCESKDYAFYKLGDKAAVSLAGCTGAFDDGAFEYAEISDLSIDNCELEFGDSSFANNGKMEKAQIGNGKYTFGEYSFYKCDKAVEFTIGGEAENNEYEIDDSFGSYCTDLTTLNLGAGRYTVGSSFFSNCKSLADIVINDKSDLEADEYTFYGASDELKISYQNQVYGADSFANMIE